MADPVFYIVINEKWNVIECPCKTQDEARKAASAYLQKEMKNQRLFILVGLESVKLNTVLFEKLNRNSDNLFNQLGT